MRFLLVEDNGQLARAVCERFALDGHAVDHATGLNDASAFVDTTYYAIKNQTICSIDESTLSASIIEKINDESFFINIVGLFSS